jgi:hypothetical protein
MLPFWQDWLCFLIIHGTSQAARLPFWQDWLRLRRFRGRGEAHLKPFSPAYFIQINNGFVSQISREPAPTLQNHKIDRFYPD